MAIGLSFTALNNIILEGEGQNIVLYLNDSVDATVLSLTNCTGWRISDLEIYGNKANQAGCYYGVSLVNATDTVIDRCLISDSLTYGLSADALSTVAVSKSTFLNSGNDHVVLACQNGSTVEDNWFGPSVTNYNYVSTINNASGISIIGNTFYNNTGRQGIGVGIEYNSSSITVSDNNFVDCKVGIETYVSSAVNGITISGNNMLWTGQLPYFDTAFAGIVLAGGNQISVVGNTITTTSWKSSDGRYGIWVEGCAQASVIGNTISNFKTAAKDTASN